MPDCRCGCWRRRRKRSSADSRPSAELPRRAAQRHAHRGKSREAFVVDHADLGLCAVARCRLVIEAVFENLQVKKQVFDEVRRGREAGRDSRFQHIGVESRRHRGDSPSARQDVIGLHFFSPANVMRLLEVVRAARTARDVLATAMEFAKRIGKIAVVAGRLRRLHRQPHDRPATRRPLTT